MNNKIISEISEMLNISQDEVIKNSKELAEIDAVYAWNPIRGGRSIIINQYGERLIANSSISFNQLKQDFIEGMRN